MLKMKKSRRDDEPKVVNFQSKLNSTMKFYKKMVLKDMSAKEKGKSKVEKDAIDVDIEFIKSMLSHRVATYSGKYKVASEKAKKRIERQKQRQDRKEIELHKLRFDIIEFESGNNSCEEAIISEAGTSEPERKHRRIVKNGVNIFAPHDILKHPTFASSSIRIIISPTQLSAIVYLFVKACNGDPSKLSLNARTTYRNRSFIEPKISLKIKKDWTAPLKLLWIDELKGWRIDKHS